MKSIDRILIIAVVFIGLGLGSVFRHFDHPAEATVYNVTAPGSVGVFDHLSVRGTNGLPSADFEGTVMTSLNAGEITLSGVTRSTWPSGASPNTTKGDLFGFSTLDARVPIGLNRQLLQADSTQSLGLGYTSDIHTSTATFTTSTHTSLAMSGAVNPSGQNATAGFIGISVTSIAASDTVTFKGGIHDSNGGGGTKGQVLTVGTDNQTPYWAAASGGGGAVVQIKQTTITGQTSTTSTSYVDITGLSVSITPTSSSNNIFAMLNSPGMYIQAGSGDEYCGLQIVRGATAIAENSNAVRTMNGVYIGATGSLMVLDSPATTTATTYKAQLKATGTSANCYNSGVGGAYPINTGSLIVMEVTP